MKKTLLVFVLSIIILPCLLSQENKGLKVFISVDMEGITGVVHWEEVSRTGKDYDMFRRIMTLETNAAIEGAAEAGATEIIVRDSHGSARNILPELLDPRAMLLRDWSGGHIKMMQNIDESFDAVIFIGYHAKAGTPDATLEHTNSSSNITDVSINGVSLPEAGMNALIAGYYDVPVVFVSGDLAICKQVQDLFGEVETVAVKEGVGKAALNFHPDVSHALIRKGVIKSLKNINSFKPYKMESPYTLVVKFKNEEHAYNSQYFPGVKRTGDWEATFKHEDLLELVKTFVWLYK
jgi:D-amino peptidase